MKDDIALFYRSLSALQFLAIAVAVVVLLIVLTAASGLIAPRSLMGTLSGLTCMLFSLFSLVCAALLMMGWVFRKGRPDAPLLVSLCSSAAGAVPVGSVLLHYFLTP